MYDDLLKGWAKWNAKHAEEEDATTTDLDYPKIGFFDNHINPPALRRILVNMLNPDPLKRYTIAEVIKNRWFRNVECCQVDTYDQPAVAIDASKSQTSMNGMKRAPMKVVVHKDHLPPQKHLGHRLVRLPGSTDM